MHTKFFFLFLMRSDAEYWIRALEQIGGKCQSSMASMSDRDFDMDSSCGMNEFSLKCMLSMGLEILRPDIHFYSERELPNRKRIDLLLCSAERNSMLVLELKYVKLPNLVSLEKNFEDTLPQMLERWRGMRKELEKAEDTKKLTSYNFYMNEKNALGDNKKSANDLLFDCLDQAKKYSEELRDNLRSRSSIYYAGFIGIASRIVYTSPELLDTKK